MFITESIWQCVLVAKGDGGGEWMNILFIVVVAVFWAIGGIVKAAGAGRKDRQQENRKASEQDQPRPKSLLEHLARKAEQIQRAGGNGGEQRPRQTQRQAQEPRRPKPEKPPAGRVTVHTGRGGEPVLVYERQKASLAPQRQERSARPGPGHAPATRTRLQGQRPTKATLTPAPPEIPSAASLSRQPLQPRRSTLGQPVSTSDALPALLDYSNPDALKRAILHYEILGKPLSLRDPFERMSGF